MYVLAKKEKVLKKRTFFKNKIVTLGLGVWLKGRALTWLPEP